MARKRRTSSPIHCTFAAGLVLLIAVTCTEGLKRTDLEEWELRRFDHLGFEVMLPEDTYVSDFDHAVLLQLHPVHPGLVLADTRFLITVDVERTTVVLHSENFDEMMRYVAKGPSGDFQKWMDSRHDSIDRRESGRVSYYRYDVDCPEAKLLIVEVEQIAPVEESLKRLDDAAIQRILESVRCF